MKLITSADNNKIKLIRKLHQAKYRRQEKLLVAEGVRLAEMAADSAWECPMAMVTAEALAMPRVQELAARLEAKGTELYQVDPALYSKCTDTVTPQGILVVLRQQYMKLADLCNNFRNPLLAVLDGIQDPGNAGTIIRTADAAGFSGVICLTNTVDVFGDKAVRASMGSLFHLPLVTGVTPRQLIEDCHCANLPIMATALDRKAVSCYEADLSGAAAIVFGNEGNGASQEILEAADTKLFIPMSGAAESLNVAVAAGVTMYEARRQHFGKE